MASLRSFPVRAFAALSLSLPALAACQGSRETTGSIAPADYRDRHPIALASTARILDLFVEGPSGLSPRSRQDIASYLREYERYGNSGLVAQVPVGTENASGTRNAIGSIRAAVGGRLAVESYHPADPTIASPIRLTFKKLQAKVSDQCGTWPEDLGVSDYAWNASNRQWHNFGCAYQSNIASQIADPNDLVRGRLETPPDTSRRMYNIGEIRKGDDPSTRWRTGTSTVKQSISE